MAGKVLNIKACNALKLHSGLTSQHHVICHYSYNLPIQLFKVFIPIMDIIANLLRTIIIQDIYGLIKIPLC